MAITIPDSHRDLIDKPHTATLSTVGPDGGPQVSALFFMRDGDTIVTSVTTKRQKYKNVLAYPKASLFVMDPTNTLRTIEVRADVSIEDDSDLVMFHRIARHVDEDPDLVDTPRDNRVVLRLTPTRVVTFG